MSKLYLRLYLFAVVIMVTSGVISSYVIDLVYRHDMPPGPPPEALEMVKRQASLLVEILPQQQPDDFSAWKRFAQAMNWDLSIWQQERLIQAVQGPPPRLETVQDLEQGRPADGFYAAIPLGERWLLVHPKPFMRGPPPVRHLILPYLMTSLILMILLIPFVQRIVKPFNHLLASIRQVSVGNYETPIRLKAGSEFEGLANEFNHMLGQIKKTLAEKQRLIADVSHELRSPLARLRLSLELIEKRGTVPEKYYHRAVSEIEQLDALIDDLLDSSRLELRAHFSPETTEINSYVQGLIDKNQVLFNDRGLEVRLVKAEQAICCDIDRELIERIFNNLISNTLKYAQPPAKLKISLGESAGAVELRFRDNGPGVAEADLTKIFDPFYRTDDSRTRSTGGAGLGLSIVRKIVQLHRGEIRAMQPENGSQGLEIALRLPALVTSQTRPLG